MAGAWFVLFVVLLVLVTGLATFYVKFIMPRHLSYGPVGRQAFREDDPAHYDEPPARGAHRHQLPSEYDTEGRTEGSVEAGAEATEPSHYITEKALQLQVKDAYEAGLIDLYAVLLRGGFLAEPVKVEALKKAIHEAMPARKALFPMGGGSLQRFNQKVEAVPVRPPVPEPAAPPRVTPLAERATDARFLEPMPRAAPVEETA